MFRNRPVSLVLVGLFVWLTGCTSYKQIGLDEVADHGEVRVTTTDGERQTLQYPRVEVDSIKGQVTAGVEQVIPSDQVVELEAAGTNTVGTLLIVIGALGVAFLALGVAVCGGFGDCD